MAATTTIRLPPKLRARLGALAKQTGRSAHSLIVEAVERHTEYEEQMRGLVKDALAADRDIEKTGEVYRAEDLRLGQEVALKFPSPAWEADATMRERFLDEVRLARRVSHAHVCRVYDVGEVGGVHRGAAGEGGDGEREERAGRVHDGASKAGIIGRPRRPAGASPRASWG